MMKGRLQRWFFLLTFAFNIFALFTGIMGFLAISERRVHPTGMYLFFAYVLVISPILSIIVLAQYPWDK